MPGGASSNGTSLVSGVWGAWSVAIASIVPSSSGAQRVDVGLLAQRRVHLEHRIEARARLVGEHEVLRRALGGHAHAVGLRRAHERGRRRARHVQHVVAAAGALRELQVAGDDRRLRFRRAAGDAEPRRPRAFVHVAARDERGVLGVLGEDRAGQRGGAYSNACRITSASATQSPSSVNTRTPRSYSSPSGASSSPRRPLVMQPAGRTSHRPTARARSSTDCTTAASSIGGSVFGMQTTAVQPPSAAARAGLDRLAVLAAGFPEVHLDVDEPGRDDAALGVEHGRAGTRGEQRTDLGDDAVDDTDVGRSPLASSPTIRPPGMKTSSVRLRQSASRAEQRPQHGHAHRDAVRDLFGDERARRVGDLPAISIPRFIGPGCITSVSGLHRAARSTLRPQRAAYSRSDGNSA